MNSDGSPFTFPFVGEGELWFDGRRGRRKMKPDERKRKTQLEWLCRVLTGSLRRQPGLSSRPDLSLTLRAGLAESQACSTKVLFSAL